MADEIRQQLTFDASQAISQLDSLNSSLSSARTGLSNFGRSLSTFNRNAAGATTTLNNIAQAAGRLRQNLGGGIIPTQATAGVQRATGLVDQFGNSLSSQAAAATTAQTANNAAASGVNNAGQAAGRAQPQVQRLTVSFGTLARIISTQLTVRAFAGLLQGLRDATSSAIDFQLRVAEIQSIAAGSFTTFDEVANAVRGISDAFNQPLGEVQEGLYQVISNQIQGAANQIQVLESSANLAKVGVADLSDTVGLLTGTINAFELDASQANQISAVFFETVRLGRTRISELANSFGTVAPLAAEAGVQFEELAAAFATITVNGVDTAKAATQLRGIINAFIKPTTDLQEVLSAAGFASGEAAIQTLGLGGALALLQDATGGSTTELAKLVPRVRGLSGALVLARNDGESLNNTVTQLQDSAQDLLREKLDIRLETNAEQVEAAINRVSNALTVDLGQQILDTVNAFLEFTGAADLLIGGLQILSPTLITLATGAGVAATSVGLYVAAARLASIANSAFATTSTALQARLVGVGVSANAASVAISGIGTALLAVGGFAAGFQIGNQIAAALDQQITEGAQAASESIQRELVDGALGQAVESRRQATRAQIANIQDVTRAQQQALNTLRQQEQQREQVFLQTNQSILQDTDRVFDALLDANRELLRGIEQTRDDAAQAEVSSAQRVADIRATIEDRAFQQSISFLNDRQRLFQLEQRGAELAAQANRDLARAQTEQDAQTALGQLQRAEGFLQEAEAIAQSSGDLRLQNRLFQTRQSISQQTLRSEQQFARTQASIRREAEQQLQAEQERVRQLNREVNEARTAIEAFQQAESPDAQFDALRRARQEIADITPQLAFGTGQLDFGQIVSFEGFISDFENRIKDADVQTPLDQIFGAVQLNDLSSAFAETSTTAVLQGIREAEAAANAEGLNLRATIDLSQTGTQQLQSTIDQLLQQSQSQIQDAEDRQAEARRRAARSAAGIGATAEVDTGVTRTIGGAIGSAASFLGGIAAGNPLDRVLQDTSQFNQVLTQINQRAIDLGQNLGSLSFGAAQAEINRLQVFLDEVEAAAGPSELLAQNQLRTEISERIALLQQANQVGLSEAEQSVAAMNNQLQQIPNAGQQFANALQQAEQSSARIQQNLSNSGTVQNQATGGKIRGFSKGGLVSYFNNGGFVPRGTDRIPAMLSKGEFVVNARSTRRFYSELQAMNAGIRPVYRQEGGPVTNVNVGDINVTSRSTKDGAATGRQIARTLQRELRRNTSQL